MEGRPARGSIDAVVLHFVFQQNSQVARHAGVMLFRFAFRPAGNFCFERDCYVSQLPLHDTVFVFHEVRANEGHASASRKYMIIRYPAT